jgi:rubrerythrin
MDYKIEDKNVKKIVDELRIDFNSELFHIKSTKDLTEKEMNEVEIKLKEKFSQKLNDRISDIRFKERVESGNMTEQEKKEEQKRIEAEEDEVVQSVSDQHWTGEKNKCPACGAAMGDNITTCPECGLTINSTV